MAVDPREARLLGQATVTGVRFVRNQQRLVALDRAITGMRPASASAFDDATQLYLVPTAGFAVRGCEFRSQLKTAAVLRGAGVFEGNSVRGCAFGVHAVNSAQFREGPYPHDLAVKGNDFRDVMFGAIDVLCLAPELRAPLGSGIVIESNRIYQRDGNGIVLVNIESALVRDNQVTFAPGTPEQYTALRIEGCRDVTVEGLAVRDARVASPASLQPER
jgi:hypothetical protein